MQAFTISQAQNDLAELVEHVISDAEPIIIVSDTGQQVVCLSLDEFNSWKETVYLVASPANAMRLRQSLAEAASGNVQSQELVDP